MKFLTVKTLLTIGVLSLSALGQSSFASENAIKSAIDNPQRPQTDRDKDDKRQPQQIIEFFKVQPATTVLDVLAGSGYYSEILSRVVGEQGKVIIHNDKHFLKYYGENLSKRLEDGDRLANTVRMDISLNDLELEENSVDTIFLILGYHDFFYIMSEAEKINVTKVLAKFKKFLKPDGIIGIVDHEAMVGAPSSVGGTLHRIDPAIVKSQMAEAGFTLDGELPILQNNTDDKSQKIWDIPGGMTSRFVLRFKNNK
ncbi:class I SAM-dependent methyltransferase [Neptunicella sp. SCSIO 80796]|uniref:class I SAM-dependent methyltransferase n=1 Tax=Neptunicella plasticusilytica TaxID=3117012 RepID=UPI003A4E41CB